MKQFDKDLTSVHAALFLEARQFLLASGGINETQKVRITTYGNEGGGICHLRSMPHGIDIGFLKGAKMQDEYDLLTGKGKLLRVLSLTAWDPDLVSYYLIQALAINASSETV